MRDAPIVGGVNVSRGNGEIIRMRRGASISDFADKIETITGYTVQPGTLVTILFNLGEMATATESLDEATFEVLGVELGYKIQMVSPEDEDKELLEGFGLDLDAELEDENEDDLEIRPPVVTVMGHVDHGKTRLLDAIRQTNVVAGEAGGITQHIGAYQVWTEHEGIERAITFIDTPGHEAFTAMRARGAQVTDLAILVVAADDGIMPQTVEALNHAQAAGVPIVVAVNKIDKPDANPAKVRQQLTEYGLVAEEYGGDVMFVDVSARKNIGIQELLDAVLLTADAGLDLTANPNKAARGVAIEAKLDKGRGSVATVLIQSGTLRVGDSIVAGTAYGRVRAMADENGDAVLEAYPSRPVQVQGLNSVPRAGDTFIVTDEDRLARQIAEKREAAERNAQLAKARKRISLEDFTRALEEGKVESLNLIIKGDVSGAVEALEESLLKIEVDDSVQLRIIHRGVGAITESRRQPRDDRQRDHHRVQRPPRHEGARARLSRGCRHALLLGHLQRDRRRRAVAQGHAQAGVRRDPVRCRRDPRGVPLLEVRQHRRCHRPLRHDHAQREGARHPRWRRARRWPGHRVAAPLQGRRHRGPHGLRGRYRPRQVQRHPDRRRDRDHRAGREASRLVPLREGRLREDGVPHLAERKNNGQRTSSTPGRPHPRHPRGASREGSPRPAPRVRDDHRRARHGRPAARVGVLHGARHATRSASRPAEALKSATGMLRSEVGKHLNVRLTPSLEFIPDAIPENADHIAELLREARERDEAVAGLASSANYAGDADPYVKPREFDEDDEAEDDADEDEDAVGV